jgi:hypothetical protein
MRTSVLARALPLALLACSLFLNADGVGAAGEKKAAETKLALRSAYLVSPITVGAKKYHQIALVGAINEERAGMAELRLDPNICKLSRFGDPTGCTEIAVVKHKVKLKFLRVFDEDYPDTLDRMKFIIEGDQLPNSLYLVIPKNAKASYRFLIGSDKDGVLAVVTLEPMP